MKMHVLPVGGGISSCDYYVKVLFLLLCCVAVSCICLSHCDVDIAFLGAFVFVDLSCDFYQCPIQAYNF